jgi:hypothetical protein
MNDAESTVKSYKTDIVFHWECPNCFISNVTYIEYDDPWVVDCENCDKVFEVEDK